MIKNLFCTPRLRPARKTSSRLSPAMSLVDRLRDAVFRLIMLSALSKGSRVRSPPPQPSDHYHYHRNDPHRSEAVADCIEFIKKSATPAADESRHCAAGELVVVT